MAPAQTPVILPRILVLRMANFVVWAEISVESVEGGPHASLACPLVVLRKQPGGCTNPGCESAEFEDVLFMTQLLGREYMREYRREGGST